MPNLHRKRPWLISGLRPTDERLVLDRRRFLAALGVGGAAVWSGALGCAPEVGESRSGDSEEPTSQSNVLLATRNSKYTLDREITRRGAVERYINYYEFDPEDKPRAVRIAQNLTIDPWTLSITGRVKRRRQFDVDELRRRFPLEERLYRHRCVETWAMALPWVGFPLRLLLDLVEPLSSAKYVRFVSFTRPEEAPGQRPGSRYPWPYHEGLRMDEARNELTLLTFGMYGRPLARQNGAPVRLVVPWKYGYKSIKAIVEIELVEQRPATFWNTVKPQEYGFYSNVDPAVSHPRWSQAREWMIDGGRLNKRDTLPFNGYGDLVAEMYKSSVHRGSMDKRSTWVA